MYIGPKVKVLLGRGVGGDFETKDEIKKKQKGTDECEDITAMRAGEI
jgi:hypothetical protein